MNDARLQQLVAPFYLQMMRTNALEADDAFLSSVARAGRTASTDEVLSLLRRDWRPRVMGAWFALLHVDDRIPDAVLDSLRSCAGSLASPPLAVAAVVLAGSGAIDALEFYGIEDSSHGWGAHEFAAGAIEYLGATSSRCSPAEGDRLAFEDLLAVAQRLRRLHDDSEPTVRDSDTRPTDER